MAVPRRTAARSSRHIILDSEKMRRTWKWGNYLWEKENNHHGIIHITIGLMNQRAQRGVGFLYFMAFMLINHCNRFTLDFQTHETIETYFCFWLIRMNNDWDNFFLPSSSSVMRRKSWKVVIFLGRAIDGLFLQTATRGHKKGQPPDRLFRNNILPRENCKILLSNTPIPLEVLSF